MSGDTTITKKLKDLKVTVGRPNWWLMVDEVTQKNTNFYEPKNGIVETTCEHFHR